ncbi:MAG: C1 family peptidase [Candidatus Altiarchaeota archaeon]
MNYRKSLIALSLIALTILACAQDNTTPPAAAPEETTTTTAAQETTTTLQADTTTTTPDTTTTSTDTTTTTETTTPTDTTSTTTSTTLEATTTTDTTTTTEAPTTTTETSTSTTESTTTSTTESTTTTTLEIALAAPEYAPQSGMVIMYNPATRYCTDLGYGYQRISTLKGEDIECVLPDGSACGEWDFLAGKCGKGYNFCGVNGYDTEVRADGRGPLTREYAVCKGRKGRGPIKESARDFDGLSVLDALKAEGMPLLPQNTQKRPIQKASGDDQPAGSPNPPLGAPSSYDWRNLYGQNWITSVKNQGNCGSCWAFSSVGATEAKHNINAQNSSLDLDLSEEYLVSDCHTYGYPVTGAENCCGGWQDEAIWFIYSTGVPDESCMTYIDGTGGCSCTPGVLCGAGCTYRTNPACSDRTCGDRCADYASRMQNITAYGLVSGTQAAIKEALVRYGPLSVSLYVSGWSSVTKTCSAGSSDHAVVLVGYDDSVSEWILKNSWGSTWNGDGYFRVKYGQCNIENDVWYVNIRSYPQLTGSVSPSSGSTSTNFNFTANYTHPEYTLPATMRANIDGTYYTMAQADASDNDTRDGKLYYYNRTLAAGSHTYFFNATDYGGKVNVTSTASAPSVSGQNPTLGSGQVSPQTGNASIAYNFTVAYASPGNTAPSYVRVYVDSNQSTMASNGSSNYTAGVLYSHSSNLSCGAHTFYFNASDGSSTNQTAQQSGPGVNCPPTLSSGQASPSLGPDSSLFNFTVTYTDSDGDPPASINAVIDGAMKNMTGISASYASGVVYYYNGTLTAAAGVYYFKASDGNSSVSTVTSACPSVYSETPSCSGADATGQASWDVDQYTNCTGTAVLPTSTHTGMLNITGGNVLNLTATYVYLNNSQLRVDGRIILDNSILRFIR